ncbi:hypothetical protein SNE40_017928 [Patella caerulea]|uniref:Uncharacterized protein n=2 Tax=Patella caerulea TaxID=87958 RepID=A0AAN8PN63_PATCE
MNTASHYCVRMPSDDDTFYMDNCRGDCVATCTKTVPLNWAEKQKQNKRRDYYEQQKKRSTEMEREDMKHEHMEQVLLSTEEIVSPKKSRPGRTVNGCELGITCTVAIANTVFHQQWKLAKAQEEQTKTSVATMMMLKTFNDTYLIR